MPVTPPPQGLSTRRCCSSAAIRTGTESLQGSSGWPSAPGDTFISTPPVQLPQLPVAGELSHLQAGQDEVHRFFWREDLEEAITGQQNEPKTWRKQK